MVVMAYLSAKVIMFENLKKNLFKSTRSLVATLSAKFVCSWKHKILKKLFFAVRRHISGMMDVVEK